MKKIALPILLLCNLVHHLTRGENSTTLANFQTKRSYIIQQLPASNLAPDINFNLLARCCGNKSLQEIKDIITSAQKYAQQNNYKQIHMRHFEMALNESNNGPELDLEKNPAQFTTAQRAIHEAGHILATIQDPNLVIVYSSIAVTEKFEGSTFFIPTDFMVGENIELLLMSGMAGGIAEQVFNIPEKPHTSPLSTSDLNPIKINDIEVGFTNLINRPSAQKDIAKVTDILQTKIDAHVMPQNEIITASKALYEKTLKLIQDHTEEIKELAQILEQNKYISSDEIYKICHTTRPKLDIEKE